MDHQGEVDLLTRVLDNIEQETTDMTEPGISPVARYLDPAQYEREMSVLFRDYPLVVAFASQLSEPESFVTHDLAGVPILVNRDREGLLNAYLNTCRHRGTKLVCEENGSARAFVCPYHGWTYSDDGRLDHISHEEGFPHVDRKSSGLIRLQVRQRAGLIWVVPNPGSSLDIDAYLGAMAHELEAFGLSDHVLISPHRDHRTANWKLILDANLENYHVKIAHRDTIAFMFEDNVGAFDRFAPHSRLLFPKRSIRQLKGTDRASWKLREHTNVIYFIFPNTIILIEPDHAMVASIFPDGIAGFKVQGGMLIPEEPANEKARSHWRKNYEIFWNALEEDFQMVERVQEGIAGGLVPHLHFARFEQCANWFHEEVGKAVKSAL